MYTSPLYYMYDNLKFIQRQLVFNSFHLSISDYKWLDNLNFYLLGSRFSIWIINLTFSILLCKRAFFFFYKLIFYRRKGFIYDYFGHYDNKLRYFILSNFAKYLHISFFSGKWLSGLFSNKKTFYRYICSIYDFFYKYKNQLDYYFVWLYRLKQFKLRLHSFTKLYHEEHLQPVLKDSKDFFARWIKILCDIAELDVGVAILEMEIESERAEKDPFYKENVQLAYNSYYKLLHDENYLTSIIHIEKRNKLLQKDDEIRFHEFSCFIDSEFKPYIYFERTFDLIELKSDFLKTKYLPSYSIPLYYKILKRIFLNIYTFFKIQVLPSYCISFYFKKSQHLFSESRNKGLVNFSLVSSSDSFSNVDYPILFHSTFRNIIYMCFLLKNVFIVSLKKRYQLFKKFFYFKNFDLKLT